LAPASSTEEFKVMIRTGSTSTRHRRRIAAWTAATALGLALLPGLGRVTRADDDLVDLTLMFNSAVQGKIAPCG
jgi:hypothetical protein